MIDGKRVLAVVPARGDSKRLPGKNLRPFLGRPLIAWTLDAAAGSPFIDRIVVTTDDPAIRAAAIAAGGDAPFLRPAELATETASVIRAALDAADRVGGEFDYLLLLQPTSPLRLAADIDACLRLTAEHDDAPSLTVSRLPKPPIFYGRQLPDGRFLRDRVFASGEGDRIALINGAVYVSRIDDLRRLDTFLTPRTRFWEMPWERSIDIDDEIDFRVAEALAPR